MKITLTILISIVLVITSYQDFKERLVSVILFPLLLFLALTWYFLIENTGFEIVKNVLFLATLFLLSMLYFSLKNKRVVNLFRDYLGLGDVLFLLAITPFFSSQNFVLFLITGFFLTIVIHLLLNLIPAKNATTIPLAGYLANYLLLGFVCESIFNIQLFTYPILQI